MKDPVRIQSPDDPALDELCGRLAEAAGDLDRTGAWPAEQLRLCAEYGVFRWFVPREWGGLDWSDIDVVRGYLKLSAACLTTTFIITQRTGACRRIAGSDNEAIKARLLPDLADGRTFATVGISHLTTSRRHLGSPVLSARESTDGFVLDGFSPWVTGAKHADMIVTGATMDDGREILAVVPMDTPGVAAREPEHLVGVSASATGAVDMRDVRLAVELLLDGPVENVMRKGKGAGPGGLQTSTLAVGLASAAVSFIEGESQKRPELAPPAAALRAEQQRLQERLLSATEGSCHDEVDPIRVEANSLALRAAQAALGAAKGTGYVVGHPAGRWCREALFFLVWSCPQPVLSANICQLAAIQG
ncbi:MAG: acyl-CoA/acyl-ACP dehydrogenase [Planctomycetales bacterium]|nr:acyl-CoA/acyl-ACP dehydrogenase [Planctomycetales bacterium]